MNRTRVVPLGQDDPGRRWQGAIDAALDRNLRHTGECFEHGRRRTHWGEVHRRQLSLFPCPWCDAVLDAVDASDAPAC